MVDHSRAILRMRPSSGANRGQRAGYKRDLKRCIVNFVYEMSDAEVTAKSAASATAAPIDSSTTQTTVDSNGRVMDNDHNALDSPIAVLRAPRQPDANAVEVDELDTPLVALRSAGDKEYLVFSRTSSPALTEPYDEDPEDLEYIPGSEEVYAREIQNAGGDTSIATEDLPLPPSTSSHSMKNATMRSFESRVRNSVDSSAKKQTDSQALKTTAAAKKVASAALSRSLSSIASMSPSGAAPSDVEMYNTAGCAAPPAGEKAADFRVRFNSNFLKILEWIFTMQKALAEVEVQQQRLEQQHNDHYKHVLQSMADMQLSSPSPSSSLVHNTATEIVKLRKAMVEGRESLSKVTECVNGLIDVPFDLAEIQRAVRDLSSRAARTAAAAAAASRSQQISSARNAPTADSSAVRRGDASPSRAADHHRGGNSSSKRRREHSPDREAPAKLSRPSNDYFDVYMWDVNLAKGSPMTIAKKALRENRIAETVLISCMHPPSTPKSLISIRFANQIVAQQFMDRMQVNPPKGMEHLAVCSSSSYGKRREETRENDDNFW
ncbi:hypothetical protein C8R43DRAFT_1027162 [Mycena crocata]|nr:hypothetical protein C8R43DRAFT_1027162 [Mycena crocata]